MIQQTALPEAQKTRKLIGDFQTLLQSIPASQIVAGAKAYLVSIGKIVP